jgi:hypothetical protein
MVAPEAARLLPNEGDVRQAVACVVADGRSTDSTPASPLPTTSVMERFRREWKRHYGVELEPPSRRDQLKALRLEETYSQRALSFAINEFFESSSENESGHPFRFFVLDVSRWIALGAKMQRRVLGFAKVYREDQRDETPNLAEEEAALPGEREQEAAPAAEPASPVLCEVPASSSAATPDDDGVTELPQPIIDEPDWEEQNRAGLAKCRAALRKASQLTRAG